MEFKVYLLLAIFIFAACEDATATGDCSLKKYIECSKEVDMMTVSNACPQLKNATDCMKDLLMACGEKSPLCSDLEPIRGKTCMLLDGGGWSPMAEERNHKSGCRLYDELLFCQGQNCQTGGPAFKDKNDSALIQCSIDKRDQCLGPVMDVTVVNAQTCIDVGKAKNCYLDNVRNCRGTRRQLTSASILAAGLAWHVKQCKKNNLGFNNGAGLCVPNAVDVAIDDDVEEIIDGHTMKNQLTTDRCSKIFAGDKKLENYVDTCAASASQYNKDLLNILVTELAPWNTSCTEAAEKGYPDDDKGGADAVFKGHILGVQALMVALFVFLMQGLQS